MGQPTIRKISRNLQTNWNHRPPLSSWTIKLPVSPAEHLPQRVGRPNLKPLSCPRRPSKTSHSSASFRRYTYFFGIFYFGRILARETISIPGKLPFPILRQNFLNYQCCGAFHLRKASPTVFCPTPGGLKSSHFPRGRACKFRKYYYLNIERILFDLPA